MNPTLLQKRSTQDMLVLYGSGITILFILPFAIYRLMAGDYTLAMIDLILCLGLVAFYLQTYYTQQIKPLHVTVLVCFYSCAVISIIYLKPAENIFWVYPAIIATYFLLKPLSAAILNSVFVGIVISIAIHHDPANIKIYPIILMFAAFGFIFGIRAELQNRQLSKLITQDEVTQVRNRRAFDKKIDELLAHNQRAPEPSCLTLIHLERAHHFSVSTSSPQATKEVDGILYQLVQQIKSVLRRSDKVYRFDEHRFAVISKRCELANAEKLAQVIYEHSSTTASQSNSEWSINIGLAQLINNDNAISYFQRANIALAKARENNAIDICSAILDQYGEIACKPVTTTAGNTAEIIGRMRTIHHA